MADDNKKESKKEISNPAEILFRSFEEIAKEKVNESGITQDNPIYLSIPDDADWASSRFGIFEYKNQTIQYQTCNGDTLQISIVLNGIFDVVQKLKDYPNNRTENYGEAVVKVQVRTDKGTLTSPFELDAKAKSSAKDFKACLNKASNYLIFKGNDKTLDTIRILLNKKCTDTIYCLSNAGKICFDEFEGRLYKNAYTDVNKTIFADKNGVIVLSNGKKVMLKNNYGNQLPILTTEIYDDFMPFEVIQHLLYNTETAFKGQIQALLALGLGIMGAYADKLWQENIGFPVGFLYGPSKQGKSTLTSIISYMYGFDKNFIAMGNSTTRAIDRKANLYNNCILPFDDISASALLREYYENLIVEINENKLREKLKTGSDFNLLPVCSPIIFSSNYFPVQKEKMLNRMLPLEFLRNGYDPAHMSMYYKNPRFLSATLPEILSQYSWEKVHQMIEEQNNWLAHSAGVMPSRESYCVAVAYVGLLILIEYGSVQLEDVESRVLEYFDWYLQQFKELEEPIDALLNHFAELMDEGIFKVEEEVTLKESDNQVLLILRTQQCLDKFNAYIGRLYHEKFINSKEFMKSVKDSPYFVETKNARFKPKSKRIPPVAKSLYLNIKEHAYCEDIIEKYRYWEDIKRKAEESKESDGANPQYVKVDW